jgi:hypothetical protein
MGQYQQWLHYQAIDRRLRTQVATLEEELAQIQLHLALLEQQQEVASLTDNPIVQALIANQHIHNVSPKSTDRNTNGSTTSSASDLQSSASGDSISPEDMMAFFEEHAQTDPQLELPWWLRNIAISSKDKQGNRPIDHHSIRTNRLVQRWIERWGRQSSTTLKPTGEEEEGTRE